VSLLKSYQINLDNMNKSENLEITVGSTSMWLNYKEWETLRLWTIEREKKLIPWYLWKMFNLV
jgi:hypothetical protein